MDEPPSDRPSRPPIAEISSAEDPTVDETSTPNRLGLWLGAVFVLVAAVAGFIALHVQSQDREETAAVGAAVKRYAEIFHQSPKTIHKYCKFRSNRGDGGGWRVSITRVIVPDNQAGYGITSIFKVDRSGACEYVGQVEETGK